MNAHESPVAFARFLAYQAAAHRAIDQAHHRVVALLQEFSKFADVRPTSSGMSCDPEQKLMLLGRHSRGAGGFLAESQESPQMIAKASQTTDERLVRGGDLSIDAGKRA